MQLITKRVPMNCNIFQYGDDHEGSIMRHNDGWNQMVDQVHSEYDCVKAKHNFMVDHGDIIEAIEIKDKRYDKLTVKGTVLQQIRRAVKNRLPIQDKLITVLDGNHPLTLKGFGMITEDICGTLKVPFGTYMCKIVYKNNRGKILFKQLATHGSGSINSTADDPLRIETNLKLSLKRKLKNKSGDALLMSMGHTHKLIYAEPKSQLIMLDDGERITAEYTGPRRTSGYIHPDYRHYLNTGSFYKLYGPMGVSGYAERAMYDPIELGYWIVKIRDGKIAGIDKQVLS